MTSIDGSFCLPVCVFVCVCFTARVFIGSSVSHISLEGWNNLSGTVFPRVLYLTYLFVLPLFLNYVCVCEDSVLLISRVFFFFFLFLLVLKFLIHTAILTQQNLISPILTKLTLQRSCKVLLCVLCNLTHWSWWHLKFEVKQLLHWAGQIQKPPLEGVEELKRRQRCA